MALIACNHMMTRRITLADEQSDAFRLSDNNDLFMGSGAGPEMDTSPEM